MINKRNVFRKVCHNHQDLLPAAAWFFTPPTSVPTTLETLAAGFKSSSGFFFFFLRCCVIVIFTDTKPQTHRQLQLIVVASVMDHSRMMIWIFFFVCFFYNIFFITNHFNFLYCDLNNSGVTNIRPAGQNRTACGFNSAHKKIHTS